MYLKATTVIKKTFFSLRGPFHELAIHFLQVLNIMTIIKNYYNKKLQKKQKFYRVNGIWAQTFFINKLCILNVLWLKRFANNNILTNHYLHTISMKKYLKIFACLFFIKVSYTIMNKSFLLVSMKKIPLSYCGTLLY